jgi:hypothetical protein
MGLHARASEQQRRRRQKQRGWSILSACERVGVAELTLLQRLKKRNVFVTTPLSSAPLFTANN